MVISYSSSLAYLRGEKETKYDLERFIKEKKKKGYSHEEILKEWIKQGR